jgi:hypothetical protein
MSWQGRHPALRAGPARHFTDIIFKVIYEHDDPRNKIISAVLVPTLATSDDAIKAPTYGSWLRGGGRSCRRCGTWAELAGLDTPEDLSEEVAVVLRVTPGPGAPVDADDGAVVQQDQVGADRQLP